VKNPRIKTWGPTAVGLSIVPFLPYLFDEPVEHVTDKVFEWIKIRIAKQEVAQAQEKNGKTEL
jgi:mitochondrial fission process protein 1